jgi:hypothetical protein
VKISEHNLIEEIRAHFPELEKSYQEELRKWDGQEGMPSNYIVVANVFQPRFAHELADRRPTEVLERCADFIEKVCTDGDVAAINVIWVKVFEWLIFRPSELKFIWPLLGPVTRANIREAALRWSEAGRELGNTEHLPEHNIPPDLLM